jgi:uncharacterized protein
MAVFKEELALPGSAELPITFDISFNPDLRGMPIVIFSHGFKGFKDWGPWNKVAEHFASHGVFFLKMNFSHNGVVPYNLTDITDPETFGRNTLTKELDDLKLVIDWLAEDNELYRHYFDAENISLIGHSLGASISLIQTIEDERISRVISWSGAFNLRKFSEMEDDVKWKEAGFIEIKNGRTGDIYPLYYSFREDFLANAERLDLTKKLADMDQSILMIHGKNDAVSPISNARKIHQFVSHSLLIENEGDHVFGGIHPFDKEALPPIMSDVVQNSLDFILL